MSFLVRVLASGFGTGYTPYLSGTVGSLVGVPIFFVLSHFNWLPYFAITSGLTLFAIWISNLALPLYTHPKKQGDPSQIVIDEVVGQMITFGLFAGSYQLSAIYIATGFALFRLFDITKPFPIRRLERLPGGLGVVADDVGAGLYALIALALIQYGFGR